jgi:F-box-like
VSQGVTIGYLPDDVLLEIFYQVYQVFITRYWHDFRHVRQWHWHELVHVCQRWRSIIFSSPRYLKLQLVCTPRRPVNKLLDIWPTLPLRVCFEKCTGTGQADNLIAALERHGRIHSIHIGDLQGTLWERISTVMQGTFPELTSLSFQSRPWSRDTVFLPDTFLNGTASCLQCLIFREISFPSLPRLLLTATNLTSLHLEDIPNAGYISPEAMATCLSTLPRLKFLTIKFQIWTPHPNRRNRPPPPRTRFVLPALIRSEFKGIREYLEVLAARIDAPLLGYFEIDFFDDFHQPFFDMPEIIRFLAHLEPFRPSKRLTLILSPPRNILILFELDRISRWCRWCIACQSLDWQLIWAAHICSRILSFRSSVESLTILYADPDMVPPSGIQPDEIEPTIWLQLFRTFTSLQNLRISTELERSIADALQGFTRQSVVEVFPSIDLISIVEECGGVIYETKLAYNRSSQPVTTL